MRKTKFQIYQENRSKSDKIADNITQFVGSWKYIIFQSVFIFCWIILNTLAVATRVDPYPFIFLNLVLAIVGVYITPLILMSQNRQESRDRIRDDEDLETDLKSEKYVEEIRKDIKEIKDMLVKK